MVRILLFLTFLCCSFSNLRTQNLEFWAKSVLLMDARTGSLLYEFNADYEIAPASLTKILTLYMVYKSLESGHVDLKSCMQISPRADFRNQDQGSTVMYLKSGYQVTLYELMLGLAIASGNDAAIAIAENLSGSLDNFVSKMNQQIQDWGLQRSLFVDASGLDAHNRVTARELSEIVRRYLQNYPQSLEQLHAVQNFRYTELKSCRNSDQKPGSQYLFHTRVPLLENYEGMDGLKTGYTYESGYNLVSTAQRNKTRLIGIVLGVSASSHELGSQRRTQDMKKLFDYGFEHFETVDIADFVLQTLPVIYVRKGSKKNLKVDKKGEVFVTVRKNQWQFFPQYSQNMRWKIKTPVTKNTLIKRLKVDVISSEGKVRKIVDIVAQEDIICDNKILGFRNRLLDFFHNFFGVLSRKFE